MILCVRLAFSSDMPRIMSAAPHVAKPRGSATAGRRFRGGASRVVVVAPTAPRARPPSGKPPRTKAVGALQWVVKDPLINVYAADYAAEAGGAAHAAHWKALEARRAREVVARGMYIKARQQRFAASGFSNLLVRLPYHPTAPQRRPIWKVGRSGLVARSPDRLLMQATGFAEPIDGAGQDGAVAGAAACPGTRVAWCGRRGDRTGRLADRFHRGVGASIL